MKFERIDINTWKRREYFNRYINTVPCTYSMTVNLDATIFLKKLKEKDVKLYPAIIYALSLVVNKYEEFRMSLDEEKNLGIFDIMNPSYTIFHSSSETFSSIWTRFDEHFLTFYKDYQNDIKTYGEISDLIAKTNMPINNFNISMLPWTSFTGFNLNIPKSINYLLPIFTMGKYFKDNTKCLLPLSIQVHHAVCDGFHLCRFINSLQELIDKAAFIENINSEMT